MKAYEVPKGDRNEPGVRDGRVVMAVEGAEQALYAITQYLKDSQYLSTNCQEMGDKDGDIIEFFVISRTDKPHFMKLFKIAKSMLLPI